MDVLPPFATTSLLAWHFFFYFQSGRLSQSHAAISAELGSGSSPAAGPRVCRVNQGLTRPLFKANRAPHSTLQPPCHCYPGNTQIKRESLPLWHHVTGLRDGTRRPGGRAHQQHTGGSTARVSVLLWAPTVSSWATFSFIKMKTSFCLPHSPKHERKYAEKPLVIQTPTSKLCYKVIWKAPNVVCYDKYLGIVPILHTFYWLVYNVSARVYVERCILLLFLQMERFLWKSKLYS